MSGRLGLRKKEKGRGKTGENHDTMDLSTMCKKLDGHKYPNAQVFFSDFKLMIHDCFPLNPAGMPVNMVGIKLQQLFNEK